MTEGNIWKQIILFAVPMLIGNLFQQLYNTVDSMVVGNYVSTQALAAVGSTPLPAALCRRMAAGRAGRVLDALEPAALLALLAVCTAFLVSGSANPFLYFRF